MTYTRHYNGYAITVTSLQEASGTVSWYGEVIADDHIVYNVTIPEADSALEAVSLVQIRYEARKDMIQYQINSNK